MNRFAGVRDSMIEHQKKMDDMLRPKIDKTNAPTEYPTVYEDERPLTEAEVLSNDRAERFSIP